MSNRWIWAWFPELLRLETTSERAEVYHRCYGRVMKRPIYWIIAGVIQIGAQIVVGIPAARFAKNYTIPRWLISSGIPLLIAVACIFVIIWVMRRAIIRHIRRELNTRGLPTCIRCGYQLRGLPETVRRCPECGATRQTVDGNADD